MNTKKAIIPAITLLTVGCMPSVIGVREARDVNYIIDKGTETQSFKGKSDFTVVLLPDDHASFGCQANTYLTLEKYVLSGEVKFVAREGRVGPTEHDNKAFKTMRYFDSELQVNYYKDFLELSLEERKQTAHFWIESHQFPSQYRHNLLADKPSRNWNEVLPMMATVLDEAVYQNRVQTIGVESQEALDNADKELGKAADAMYNAKTLHPEDKKLQEQAKKDFLAVRDTQIKYRNEAMIVNIQHYASTIKERHLVPFHIGALHVPDLKGRFKAEDISYRVIEHKGCVEEIVPVPEDIYGAN